ncbi:MAG: ribosome maturation factor RimM [Burkholderiales bacterium]|nr:ribosome maturation factor RimM [Burkholderiales bacterium]
MPAPGDAPPFPADAVEVGRVLGAWGVKGGIKVRPFAADPQALFSSKRWFLRAPEPARPGAPAALPALLKVQSARTQGDTVVAVVQDLADRDAAEALKGARVFVSRASFPTPASDEFYWVDLIGLQVSNRPGQALGTVVGLIETGPHCVLRVQPADAAAAERLIPFVAAYIDAVDLPARLIRADWDAADA